MSQVVGRAARKLLGWRNTAHYLCRGARVATRKTGVRRITDNQNQASPQQQQPQPPRGGWRRFLIYTFLFIVTLLIVGRLMLPWAVRSYVNRTIDRNPLYDGKIGSVEIHLSRGAYSIGDIRLIKTTGNVPVPLFAAKRVDLQMQWNALREGKLVGQVVMERPELNFVDDPDESKSQTGAAGGGGPWLDILADLFPFKINSAVVKDGSIHFRTFQSEKPVDVYLSRLDATVDNLTNIRDETTPLVTTVKATALAMDQARFEYQMKLDPFSYRPTFHMAARLLGLDVTKVNDLSRTYGSFDFEHGWFDLVIEVDSKEGDVEGYVKPLFRNLKIFTGQDVAEDNPLQVFWEALIGTAAEILKNQKRDQVATLIPFSASGSGTSTDVAATVGNVLRNAFVRAYLPRLQNAAVGNVTTHDLQFGAPTLADPISIGD